MNLVMLPMWLFSCIFFPADQFSPSCSPSFASSRSRLQSMCSPRTCHRESAFFISLSPSQFSQDGIVSFGPHCESFHGDRAPIVSWNVLKNVRTGNSRITHFLQDSSEKQGCSCRFAKFADPTRSSLPVSVEKP